MRVELIGGPMGGQTRAVPDADTFLTVFSAPFPERAPRQGTYRLEERDETAPPRMYWQGWDGEPVPEDAPILTGGTSLNEAMAAARRRIYEADVEEQEAQFNRWTDAFHPVVPEEEPF